MRAARIPPIAFWGFIASCVLLEFVLFRQMQHMQHAKDIVPTAAFLITTLVVIGICLLFGIQVIRVGVTWQRMVGYYVCAYPVFVLLEHFYWAGKFVFSR